MFKSLFAKYLTAFMLIIVICFTLLAVIISSIVTNYSDETQENQLFRASEVLSYAISQDLASSGCYDIEQLVNYHKKDVSDTLSIIPQFSGDLFALIANKNGKFIAKDNSMPEGYVKKDLPASYVAEVFEKGEVNTQSDLEGVFEGRHIVYAVTLYGRDAKDGPNGILLVCSAAKNADIVNLVLKTMLMASMWVLLAALIAVYFLSERITLPIKKMGQAAKAFASGHFDVRVPVTGHDEIAELAVAFNNMAGSLASLEDMRRTFLGNVSHDLRSPMTTIAGFIDGILDGAIPPEQYSHYLGIIASEVRRLSRLVSLLLDISRIQAGDRKFNMEPFDICEMARVILISFEQRIEDKKLDVEFECDNEKIYAYADRDAIYQVLYNICDNGVKFACEGGKYRIDLRCKERKVYVSVYNEGQGIPADDLPYIFDRFYKSDRSRGLDKTGVGLGMYISKTIIDAHNEKIWVDSVYGEYCEFTFTLQKTHEPIPAEEVSGNGKKDEVKSSEKVSEKAKKDEK